MSPLSTHCQLALPIAYAPSSPPSPLPSAHPLTCPPRRAHQLRALPPALLQPGALPSLQSAWLEANPLEPGAVEHLAAALGGAGGGGGGNGAAAAPRLKALGLDVSQVGCWLWIWGGQV